MRITIIKLLYQFCVIVLITALSAAAAADKGSHLPTVRDLEQHRELLEGNSGLTEAVRSESLARLELAFLRRQTLQQLAAQTAQYVAALTQAPLATASAKAALDSFIPEPLPHSLEQLSAEDLELRLGQEELTLSTLRRQAADVDADINALKAFDIEQALIAARAEIATPLFDATASNVLPQTQALFEQITGRLNAVRLEVLEQQQLSRPARLAALNAEAALLARRVAAAEERLSRLRAIVGELREDDATQRVEAARDAVAGLAEFPIAVRESAQQVLRRAQQLTDLIVQQDSISADLDRSTDQRDRLEQRFANLTRQVEFARFDSAPEFGAALRTQRDNLINLDRAQTKLQHYERLLTEARLALFKLDGLRERDDHETLIALRATTVERRPGLDELEINETLGDLISTDRALIRDLAAAYSRNVDDLVRLTAQYRELITNSAAYVELLDQHLPWLPSANPMDAGTLHGLVTSFQWLAKAGLFSQAADVVRVSAGRRPLLVIVWLVVIGLLLRQRRSFVARLQEMQDKVGKVQFDSSKLTVLALFLTVLLALPGPLFVMGLSRLLTGASGLSSTLAAALSYGALMYFVLEFVIQGVRANGLAALHFNWRENAVRSLKSNLPWFMAIFIPTVVLNLFLELQGNAIVRDSLGRVAFILATLVLAAFVYRISDPRNGVWERVPLETDANGGTHSRYLRFQFLVLIPVMVAGLSAYGYHYTAVQLDAYLLNSGLVLMIATVVFYLFERVFAVRERQLTLEHARAKRLAAMAKDQQRAADQASGDAMPATLDLEQIDLQTVSTQTRALIKLMIVVVTLLVLWDVWSGFLPAFKPLEDVVLWDVLELVDGSQIAAAITLRDLLLAVFVVVVTVLGAKNIPGTLEIALLSRLSLEAGTSYAITSISRYLIVITGTLFALQILGAQWEKLQWLIAALSVGLGFGLQEIVANFVSGIVILFERPIRIGDTVTVGDQWGTVSRIRIRATTIVDWDRREIVIPNKTFITERLVNWTLTDPITRGVIKVGVAYGSDLELTERVLLEIAHANPQVLDDPTPVAVFLNFGDSTLDFELRVFVRGVRDLIPVKHELNMAIDRGFREHGIEIAFPQRDLHFDDGAPLEIKLVESNNKPESE